MKSYILLLIPFVTFSSFAQISKPALDTSAFNKWPSVLGGAITVDGTYALYNIDNEPVGNRTLVIKSLKSSWQVKFPNWGDGRFVNNDQTVLFQQKDSIGLYSLRNFHTEWISNVSSFLVWRSEKHDYLIYHLSNDGSPLIVRNLNSGIEHKFDSTADYLPYKDTKTIFLLRISKGNNVVRRTLEKINTLDFELSTIWSTIDTTATIVLNSIAQDNNNNQIAFVVNRDKRNNIVYYNGQSKESLLFGAESIPPDNSKIDDISDQGFNFDGTRLFVTLRGDSGGLSARGAVGVDIWSYKDEKLQSQQLYEIEHGETTVASGVATINISDGKVNRLTYQDEILSVFKENRDSLGFVIQFGKGHATELNWNSAARPVLNLVSTKTGIRQKVACYLRMSLGKKYLYGLDSASQYLYIYDLSTGNKFNISQRFPTISRFDEDYDMPGPIPTGLYIAGWMAADSAIIIYDKYDIWKVNIFGQQKAINVTKGYGRSHNLIFRLIGNHENNATIDANSSYILSVFDNFTKQKGFATWMMQTHQPPSILSLSSNPCEVDYNPSFLGKNWLHNTKDTTILVKCESASHSPNYFVTSDYKSFNKVSDVYPESNYNWLSSEVIHWQSADGAKQTGVLYKPENFDSTKKYPVLITYYEKLSEHANTYSRPDYATNDINIPWFVSRGYIVFTPDITYRIGYPLQSAYKSVVGGAEYLIKYLWIDSKRIAIEGHSWGAFETNYIVTHSHIFCAALSACGVSDFISAYGSLMDNGIVLQWFYEIDQTRIGATPWERPDLYVASSSVLRADRVNTPLLMMNNKNDGIVPFNQGVEFFTALRRLHKKVWMLQYDGENHNLDRSATAATDYTIRMTQFFDYYCKGTYPPVWMSEGIPARLKGIDNGFRVDKSGLQP